MGNADEASATSPREVGAERRQLWPRSTTAALLVVGALISLTTFAVMIAEPSLPWHPAREAELVATYNAYRETGVLLVKHAGEGSWVTQIDAPGGLVPAAWDDDPGVYVLASLTSHLTRSESPHAGLQAAQSLLVAAPLLVLPLGVARLFRRARAGYAMVLLPVLVSLTNHGTFLVGTEYGRFDVTSPARVYAIYGIAASLLFATLTGLLVLSTFKLRPAAIVTATVLLGLVGGLGNMTRSLSGLGPASAVGVLWLLHTPGGRARWLRAAAASGVAVTIALTVPVGAMHAIDTTRAEVIGTKIEDLPTGHTLWHSLYLGLSYPTPMTGKPSPFDIPWSDEFGWSMAHRIDPDVRVASGEYDVIMRHLYVEQIRAHPGVAARQYLEKALDTGRQFGAMLTVIVVGIGLALARRGRHRRGLVAAVTMVLPTLALGVLPPVLVMPLLYYYSEISAALGLLIAIALGALVWMLSTLPAQVRARRRRMAIARLAEVRPDEPTKGISVVVPASTVTTALYDALERLATGLDATDEIVVVEGAAGSAAYQPPAVRRAQWSYPCELRVLRNETDLSDNALRTGVLATRGRRVLLAVDAQSLEPDALTLFRELPGTTVVAIGSDDQPASEGERQKSRPARPSIIRGLRTLLLQSRMGDRQGTIWADGQWCRLFATFSREAGRMWITELLLAAEQQGIEIAEVPVRPPVSPASRDRRLSMGMAARDLANMFRLALRRDDYTCDPWLSADTGSASIHRAPEPA